MLTTFRHGNRKGEKAAILLDAAIAMFILCLGIFIASLTIGAIVSRTAIRENAVIKAIQLRGDHEAKVFDTGL